MFLYFLIKYFKKVFIWNTDYGNKYLCRGVEFMCISVEYQMQFRLGALKLSIHVSSTIVLSQSFILIYEWR